MDTENTTELETKAPQTETTEPATSSEPLSIRDTLERSYADLEKEPTQEPTDKTAKVRDDRGKFAKQKTETLQTEEKPLTEEIPVPLSWRKDAKEIFSALPAELKKEIYKREDDRERGWHEAMGKVKQQAQKYVEVDSVLAPYEQDWARRGIRPAQVIAQFMGWQEHLDSNPKKAMVDLLATYQLTPQDLLTEEPTVDPKYAALQEEFNQLKNYLSTQSETQKSHYTNEVNAAIADFASEQDEAGNLLRPKFDDLIDDMLPIADALRRKHPEAPEMWVIDRAYQASKGLRPELFQSPTNGNAKHINNTQKAKLAGSSISGAPSGMPTLAAPTSVREALLRTWDQLS